MYNVVCCDDERDIVTALEIYLKSVSGINVIKAYNGKEALEAVKNGDVHLVLLDIMMPVMDGIEAMEEIRKISNVPIILLTAKSEDVDKIQGLSAGADDYITKPFNPMEVIARVNSHIRRYTRYGAAQESESGILAIGSVELDDSKKEVTVDGTRVDFTPTEYDILKFLMTNAGKVYSPSQIYENVWHEPPCGAENAVAVHIRHIREKIEIDPANPRCLTVVWGHGYRFECVIRNA